MLNFFRKNKAAILFVVFICILLATFWIINVRFANKYPLTYPVSILELSLWALESLCVAFALGIVYAIWRLQEETDASKRAERSAERLAGSVNALIVSLDLEGNVVDFNKAAEETTGYRKDEVMGRNWFELVVPRDRFPEAWKIFEEFKKQGKSISGEFQNPILTKGGEERVIEWRNADLLDGTNIVGTISYGIDITERKMAEETLKKSEASLNNAQILGRIGDWTWDIATNTITWSKEYYHIFGFDPAKLPPNYEDHLKVYTPESAARLNAAVKKNTETGEPYELDLEISDPKEGATRWITARSETVRDAEGKIIGLRGTAQDITERKLNEEKLKELDKLKDDFLSVTTHELRSPLTPIRSQSQLLLAGDYGTLTDEQKEAVEMISRNEEALDVLSGEVLDIAKIKSNKLKLILESTDLSSVLTRAVGDLKHLAEKKYIALALSPVPVLPPLMLDTLRIRQVLGNLLENAIKFTPEHGTVSVDVQMKGQEVIVRIKDSGIGLSKENIAKLFTPFFQVESDTARKYRGTGLGLAISKGFVEAHSGKIWAESEGEGKGSTFVFTLPIRVPGSQL